jgi:hypothetical protein
MMEAKAKANVVFGEVPVEPPLETTMRYTKTGTTDQILWEAKNILKEANESGVDEKDDKQSEILLMRLQESHDDFCTSFPVIMRCIVQTRQLCEKALTLFLKKFAAATKDVKNPPSREQFLSLQADYPALCYKETHPRYNAGEVNAFRMRIFKTLKDEDKVFLDSQKEAEETIKQNASASDRQRRKKTAEFITRIKGKTKTHE